VTPEAKVKRVVTRTLESMGAYIVKPLTGGYGSSGVPDILVCWKGLFIGIECKAARGKLTELQKHNLEQITINGGLALVVNEQNASTFQQEIDNWFLRRQKT